MNSNNINKVADITIMFWLIKIVATTLGETLGDFISMTLNLGYTTGIFITLSFFLTVLLLQLLVKKHYPVIYWLVIIGTTTLGTEVSDFIDRTLHLGYLTGSIILVSLLIITLLLWYNKYDNLKVFPIANRRKEIYYWTAILFSNSLGTAFGDLLGDNFGLSYLQSAVITGGIIFVVVLLHYLSRINQIVLFWIAFIFTRPFGATFGDFLTKPPDKGGLYLGTLNSTLISFMIMALLLIFSQKRRKLEASPFDE